MAHHDRVLDADLHERPLQQRSLSMCGPETVARTLAIAEARAVKRDHPVIHGQAN